MIYIAKNTLSLKKNAQKKETKDFYKDKVFRRFAQSFGSHKNFFNFFRKKHED